MHSAAAPSGLSFGLSAWRAGLNNTGANNVKPAYWLRPETSILGTDISLVLPCTAGAANAGAFQLSVPDNTATGGNKRGAGAADLQAHRNTAAKVASGTSSIQGGINNTTSAAAGITFGDSNLNAAAACSLIGSNLISITGSDYGSAVGRQGSLRGILGQHVHAAGNIAAQADCQYERIVQGGRFTGGPNKVLVAGAGGATTGNLLTCPNLSAIQFMCQIIGFSAGFANLYATVIVGGIWRNGAAVTFIGVPYDIAGGPLTVGAVGWTAVATLDAATFGFSIQVTSPAIFSQWSVVTHAVSAT